MPYRIAGIDVHKKMLAVVVADVEVEGTTTSHKRSRIAGPVAGRKTFPTPNVW
jgi:hypothetical protein